MPSPKNPSNPTPRRASSSGASPSGTSPNASSNASQSAPARSTSRGAARSDDSRTLDLSGAPKKAARTTKRAKAAPILDVGAKRRALKKKRGRQSNAVAWLGAAAVTVAIAGTAAGIWTELEGAKARVSQKRATLTDLSAQFESGKRRLSALASASGRERVLVENGFIKPGERLLLFPQSPEKMPDRKK